MRKVDSYNGSESYGDLVVEPRAIDSCSSSQDADHRDERVEAFDACV